MSKIIIAFSDNNLDLKLMCYAGVDKGDIYKLHREYTGALVVPLPCDEFYVMNKDGDIVFIGNLTLLNNYSNKL